MRVALWAKEEAAKKNDSFAAVFSLLRCRSSGRCFCLTYGLAAAALGARFLYSHAREHIDRHCVEVVLGTDDVAATCATTPILKGEWLSPGAYINAVGATRPNWRELDDQLLVRSKLFVESREAASTESGDVIAAGEIFAELGEVIAGSKSGRGSDDEITLYKSVGVAVEDIAAADLVYRRAVARNQS